MNQRQQNSSDLRRVVGVSGAVFMGLGSILGTGIFVSIGVAAGITGPPVVLAIVFAALVATFNGLSSAQLAANHPLSGGTYEYGYRYLNPLMGFTAGWMFLCAKSASAATAALGFAGYFLGLLDMSTTGGRVLLALIGVFLFTLIVAGGIHRSKRANWIIVTLTLISLGCFVGFGWPKVIAVGGSSIADFFPSFLSGQHRSQSVSTLPNFLHASALMFVAYTGYGRIATLGEEIRNPRKNIPKAIIITLMATAVIYAAVGGVAVVNAGADGLSGLTLRTAAPLESLAANFPAKNVAWIVSVGAITAMLGVLLNLLLGLSRVVLAMARRGDLPARFANIDSDRSSPRAAVFLVGGIIAGLVCIGNVKTTWSFSAFTVLIYYALTNLAALRLSADARLYPRWISFMGLVCCLGLAFWVDRQIWFIGLGLIGLGLLWHRRFNASPKVEERARSPKS